MRSSSRRLFMIAFQSGANFIASTFSLVVCSSRIKWENWVITRRLPTKEFILQSRTQIHKTPEKELIFRSRAQIHKNPRKKELIFWSRAQIHKTPNKRVDFQSGTQFTRHPKAQFPKHRAHHIGPYCKKLKKNSHPSYSLDISCKSEKFIATINVCTWPPIDILLVLHKPITIFNAERENSQHMWFDAS